MQMGSFLHIEKLDITNFTSLLKYIEATSTSTSESSRSQEALITMDANKGLDA